MPELSSEGVKLRLVFPCRPTTNLEILRFSTFELNLETRELRQRGQKIKLQEQPRQVLAALLERPGEVVTREELRSKLWSADTFVDFDHSLNAAIKRLRDALGESAEAPIFVETLARRGYRFIGNVEITTLSALSDLNGLKRDTETGRIPTKGLPTIASGPWAWKWHFGLAVLAFVVVASMVGGWFLWRQASRSKLSQGSVTLQRLVYVLVFLLSGCQAQRQERPAEPKTQPVAIPQAQTKPSPAQEASLAAATPPNASETEVRALRRYNENTWFIQQAIRIANRDETLTGAILTVVKAGRPDWDNSNSSHQQIRGAEVASRLQPWVETIQTLEPARRAASLLIADQIVVIEEEDGNLEAQDSEKPAAERKPNENRPMSAAQVALERLGAQFSYDPASARNLYALNWLQEAYELDSNGRAGELAFLLLMERGFDTSPGCKNGSELFREVLRRGTEYLRTPRGPQVEARIHFLMGDAYRDIVALAAGQHGDTYADSATYKPEAAKARSNAVAEYRAGLALDDKSETSSIAKERLRSLKAGEAPHDTRFFCQILE